MKVNIHHIYLINEVHLMNTLAGIVSYGSAIKRPDGIWEICSAKLWLAEIKDNELHIYNTLGQENRLKIAIAWIEERYNFRYRD